METEEATQSAEETKEELYIEDDIEQIGIKLGATNPKEFSKLFNDDLKQWKNQLDNLYSSKKDLLEKVMGEMDSFDDSVGKHTVMDRAYMIAEILAKDISADKNNLEEYIKLTKEKNSIKHTLSSFLKNSKTYSKLLHEYFEMFETYQFALKQYEFARDEMFTNTLQDANTFAKVLKTTIPEDIKERLNFYGILEK